MKILNLHQKELSQDLRNNITKIAAEYSAPYSLHIDHTKLASAKTGDYII